MTQRHSTATAEPTSEKRLDVQLFEHPKNHEIRGIEFHFPEEPPAEIKELLSNNGFRFLGRRNGQWVPRWYKVQSAESWAFAQQFCLQYSHLFGTPQDIPDECIPDEFRSSAVALDLNLALNHAPETEPTPEPTSEPAPPDPAPEAAPTPPPPGDAEPPAVSESILKLVLDTAIAHLNTADDSVDAAFLATDICGAAPDAKASQAIDRALQQLVAAGELRQNADNTYSLPTAPEPAAVDPPQDIPVPKAAHPVAPAPAERGSDLFSFLDSIAAIAEEAVTQAERKIEQTLWRPTYPGGFYGIMRQWRLSIALHVIQAAIACTEEAAEVLANAKKARPAQDRTPRPAGRDIQLPSRVPDATPPSVHSSAPAAPPPAPAADNQPKPKSEPKPKPKARAAEPEIRSITRNPQICGDPIFLDDDELVGTGICCYAVLNGQIGLSFKDLVDPVTFKAGKQNYTAQPGTFQPLTMPEFAVDRLKALIQLWETYIELVNLEATPGQDDSFVESRRQSLNQAYDQFVAAHGTLTSNAKLTTFYGITDSRLSLLRSLETTDPNTDEIQKAPLFFQRCVRPSQPLDGQIYFQPDLGARCYDALMRCLDVRGGQIDLDLIASMSGLEPAEAEQYLLEGRHIFRKPEITGGHRGSL